MFIIYFLAFMYTFDSVFLFFNEYVDSVFPAVMFILLIPLYLACGTFIIYGSAEKKKDRTRLLLGIVLTIISIVLIVAWIFYYYTYIYHH